MNTTEVIAETNEIPLILAVVDKNTGQPVQNAVLSNVQFQMDNSIGTITPDATNPGLAIFKPNKTGTVNFTASATITIP